MTEGERNLRGVTLNAVDITRAELIGACGSLAQFFQTLLNHKTNKTGPVNCLFLSFFVLIRKTQRSGPCL